jgi:putative hemolysin
MVTAQEQQAEGQQQNKRGLRQGRELGANPASIKCSHDGGNLQSRYNVNGDEWTVCTFADGSACEEWALYHGKCKKGQEVAFISKCKMNGGLYRGHRIDTTKVKGAVQNFYYTCSYKNGSICFEEDYYKGKWC